MYGLLRVTVKRRRVPHFYLSCNPIGENSIGTVCHVYFNSTQNIMVIITYLYRAQFVIP